MPCLEALYLDRNLLVNLRALRKVIGARLKILDLCSFGKLFSDEPFGGVGTSSGVVLPQD